MQPVRNAQVGVDGSAPGQRSLHGSYSAPAPCVVDLMAPVGEHRAGRRPRCERRCGGTITLERIGEA
eukprot:9881037-Alexandrium_andersonii.AAC.1